MKPLSREFLLNRGFCCNLGCVNCPYGDKMEKYKPIPEDATEIYLDSISCEPECCGAIHFKIYAMAPVDGLSIKKVYHLWDSCVFYYIDDGSKELEQLRQEVKDACTFYRIEPIDIEDNCVFDWEGKRIL